MAVLLLGWLLMQTGEIDSKDFSKEMQTPALRATVKVVNAREGVTGSGAVIRQDKKFAYVLTAAHIVGKAEKVAIQVFTEESFPKAAKVYDDAEVLASARGSDLALIRITTTEALPGVLPLCPAAKAPSAREFKALTVGCAAGGAPRCLVETVNGRKAVRRPGEDAVICWEVAAAPAEGRSGGPLVDNRGYLLGIASGASDGHGYYVHPEEIERFLKKHAQQDLLDKPKE